MRANKIVHEPGQPLDCRSMHGKYCTIDLIGKDVGYAQVGIVSSGERHIMFEYRGKRGLVPKMYVKSIVELRLSERKLDKLPRILVESWDEEVNPFLWFVGKKCDIHFHQTRMFEASPGLFGVEIMYVTGNVMHVREGSREFNINIFSICGMMES